MNKPTDSLIPAFSDQEGPQPGPSWERRGWLDTLSDSASDLVAAMDPTEMKLAVKQAARDA
ncbi:MAG: 2-oxoglutarate dehydrogenase E1 component SucA, partial [Porphyrobacter sp. HL-46]